MSFTDKIKEGRSKDCFFCSFNSGTDELTPLPFSCWLPLNNRTWQITSASPISCLVRLHHLIQCSCCRFCSHLLPVRAVRQQPLAGTESRERQAPRPAETQSIWALQCHTQDSQAPSPPLLFLCSAGGAHLWGVTSGKISVIVLWGICLTVPTSLSGGAAWASLTLTPLKIQAYKLLKSLTTDHSGEITGKISTRIITVF